MDANRYQRIKNLVLEAGRREGADRDSFLAGACADDPGLRVEVERLLAGDPVATRDLALPVAEAAAEAAAAPERVGPFTIDREIGRGGMGVVYAATDTRDGRRVALKVIHPHLREDAVFLQRLAREAQAGRDVDHPNVVRTFGAEEVVDGGTRVPVLATELVAGRTLRALLEDLGSVPETLLREIAAQAAAGLRAIHAAGIVHRDLKPENILITDDQRVRIMDLGVAKIERAQELTHAGQFLGSLSYAAPEQCQGGPVDARADLYALGVVLYELATGRNPFSHEALGAVIRAQLDLRPEALTRVQPDVSDFFSEVVATLLEKEVARRFASANDLARVLVEGEAGAWWTQRSHERRLRALPRIPVQRATALHGCGAQLARVLETWSHVVAGEGAALLLEGETGLGKTRLVDEFVRGLDPVANHVLYGAFTPENGLRGLTESVLRAFAGAPLEDQLLRRLKATPRLVPAFASFLRREPGGELQADVLKTVFGYLLAALANEKPTVWVLEDLHHAPREARAIAAAMARTGKGLLLLTARPGLTGLEGIERVELSRLAPDEVLALVREKNPELAERSGTRIVEKSDGVPLFVLELVRAGGRTVPSAIRELIEARLASLEPDERTVLDAAAVQGFEFDAARIADILDRPLVRVLQDLARIERHHGLVRASGRTYRFDHHPLLEVVYEDLPERLRQEYHALLADAVGEDDPVVFAWHHLHGSRPERGLPLVAEATRRLRRRSRNEDAVALAERALAHLEGEARVPVLLSLSGSLQLLGRPDRAALDEARELARSPDEQAEVLQALAYHHIRHSEYEAALAAVDEAERLTDAPKVVTNLYGARVLVHNALGNLEEAKLWAERFLDYSRRSGDERIEAIAIGRLSIVEMSLGNYARAREITEEARAACRRVGDRATENIALGNLGVLAWRLGDPARALEHYRQYERHSRESAYRQGELIAWNNLAEITWRLGRADLAEDAERRGLAIAREIDRPFLTAILKLQIGDRTGDRSALEEALAVFHRTGHRPDAAECLMLLGRGEEAIRLARTCGAHHVLAVALARHGDAEDAESLLVERGERIPHRQRMEAHFALWRRTGAARHRDEAKRLLAHLRARTPAEFAATVLDFPFHRDVDAA